jgi:glyoxylase-like metal-dependent hydrolase (beta-lactamase superfamily II)
MVDMRKVLFVLGTLLIAACAREEAPVTQARPEAPAAEAAPAAQDNVHEFKIGELQAFALRDGGLNFPNDNKIIGVGHSPEEVGNLLQSVGASATELSLSIQPLLVKAGEKVLLFDAGGGSNMGANGGALVASMREAGLEPAAVTDVFISHFHGDHIGGLVDASGVLVFANATVHLSAPEWEHLKSMEQANATGSGLANHAALIAALSPKVNAFTPGSELIPGTVSAVEIKGHTPGHSAYLIGSGADSLLYIGDAAHHYVVSVQQPDWTIAFDTDAPTAQTSRKDLIERSAASKQRIYAVHFPFPGLGKFARSGERYVWEAQEK